MAEPYKINNRDFAQYLQSVVKLNALEKMTQDLDKELTDSQNIMMEMKTVYDTLLAVRNNTSEPVINGLQYQNVSKFVDADAPNLLMSDMSQDSMEIEIDDCIATLKTYAEDLKKNVLVPETQTPRPKEFVKLDLEQYAQSLDQLSKRVAKIKLNKRDELNNRSIELEDKLTQLCDDVNKFTAMVQAQIAFGNRNWQQQDINALQYVSIISKLLSGINEVSYLLQNKNRV